MSLDPALQRLLAVARSLGSLNDRVVFIGGSIAPILHTEAVLPYARPTRDVDAVLATHRYADGVNIGAQLRALGFRQHAFPLHHAHRWITADGVPFDLVPVGDHLGGTGSPWVRYTVESAQRSVVDSVELWHASAAAFVALKLAAFVDRGGGDPRMSHDVEDIVALCAARSSIVAEVACAAAAVRRELTGFSRALIDSRQSDEIFAAHLNNAIDPIEAAQLARQRIADIAKLPTRPISADGD